MVPLLNNIQNVIHLPVTTSDTLGHPKVLGDGTGTLLQVCALLEQPKSLGRNGAQALFPCQGECKPLTNMTSN